MRSACAIVCSRGSSRGSRGGILSPNALVEVLFELTGLAGGSWKFGAGEAEASVGMDVLELDYFASGRTSYDQARLQMTLTGDVLFAENLLQGLLILY